MKKRTSNKTFNPLYFSAAAKAYEVLTTVGIDRLPVDIEKICKHYNIKVYSCSVAKELIELFNLQNFCKTNNCFCFCPDDKTNIILINDKLNEKEQRFLIAHEIGHILLGHLGMFNLGVSAYMKHHYEIEAEVFAVSLLAPLPVLAEICTPNKFFTSSICNVPWYVADSVHSKLDRYNYFSVCYYLGKHLLLLLYSFSEFIHYHTGGRTDDKACSSLYTCKLTGTSNRRF